jgi:N-acetylglucosamine-6-phosphate deacetylase
MRGAQSSLVIRSGAVLPPAGEPAQTDVLIEGGGIREIAPGLQAETVIDAAGAYVLPGIIDLHVHGVCRESLEQGALLDFARLEAERGATTFFPSFFGAPQATAELMARHRRETNELRDVPQVGGFRLESPYLASTGAGAGDDLAPITSGTTETLLEAGGGHIRIWDISPELPGAPDAVRRLAGRGILCSIAHTGCTVQQARAAVDAGAGLVTHFYDVFPLPDLTDPDPGVYPSGLTDYLLIEDRVGCEIIGDGTHVHPHLVEITLRCKTPARVAFVTDGNCGAGLPPGRYTTPKWGDIVVDGPNHGVRLPDRGMGLAGSALTPIDSLRNAVRLFGKDLATASCLCSTTPARLMGLNKGEIAVGRDADLIILSPELELLHTIVAGRVAYSRSGDARAS